MSIDVSQRILDLRMKKNWSQTRLAQHMNFSKSTMSKIESGARKVSAEELKEFAKAFGVTTDYLLGLHEVPLSPISTNQWDIQTLLESNEQVYYTDEVALTESDKAIITDIIGGYIRGKNKRQHNYEWL